MIWILGGLAALAVFVAGIAAPVVLALANYEKFEKLLAGLFKFFTGLFKGAHKQYLKHDLQGRVNEFAKELKRDAPFLAEARIQVEFVDESVDRKSFLEEGKVVLRLRRNDREDMNFVHGAYMFVSTSLLAKVKRYISRSQAQAIDLYVVTKLLEKEKAGVVAIFLDEFLHPKVGTDPKAKIPRYFDSLAKLDAGGYFYPVLLQELQFLGNKVFGGRQDSRIIGEVDGLVQFLEGVATRNVGDYDDMNFERDYCKFAIAIVGKRHKVASEGAQPYLGYLKGRVLPADIESIYVRGPVENRDVIEFICSELNGRYETVAIRTYPAQLYVDGREVSREQCLVVLRKRGIAVFQPSRPNT